MLESGTKPVCAFVCLYWVCSSREPQRTQFWKGLDGQQQESTAHSTKPRPFPETPHWAVRDPMKKIQVKNNFGLLLTDTEQTQKHFSQVGNNVFYLMVN